MPLINRLKVISDADMDWIHSATLKILKETGVVLHCEEALEICRRKGAKVNGKIVTFPAKMVNQALEDAPETFRWQARNDDHSVTVGDKKERLLFQPNGGPVFIQDLDNGRRKATLEDFRNVIKLCHASDIVSLIGSFPVDPSDVNVDDKHLYMMHEILKNTDKPVIAFETAGPKIKQMLIKQKIEQG